MQWAIKYKIPVDLEKSGKYMYESQKGNDITRLPLVVL